MRFIQLRFTVYTVKINAAEAHMVEVHSFYC